MPDSDEIDVNRIVYHEDAVIIKINFSNDLFDQVFSKLEMINALEYLDDASEKLSIPSIYVNTPGLENESGQANLVKYLRVKEQRRKNRIAPKSILDSGLNSNFEQYLPREGKPLNIDTGNPFLSEQFLEALRNCGRKTVMFTGFFTDLEIMRASMSSHEFGYHGVTVSDATSTYSERIFYEALDLISQSSEVIDTRDLMKIWP